MKLHLGCGKKHLRGYLNIDILDGPEIDLVSDVRFLREIPNSQVEEIYACHILEHFGRHEIQNVLAEWYRVLLPNGILRLAVPNFDACVKYYTQNAEKGIKDILGLIIGGQRNQYDFHKMIFTKDSLRNLLQEAGFTSIKEWDWRNTDHSNIDDYSQAYLPHMDKLNGTLMSLNLEAKKNV